MRLSPPRPLAALLAAGAILSVGWSMATAPLQGPDEHNHFGYVQQLAETGKGPSADRDGPAHGAWSTEQRSWMRWERLLGLIGNTTARPGWTEAEQAGWRAEQERFGEDERKDGIGPNPVAQNPPLYYAYAAIPYRAGTKGTIATRHLLVRLANVPIFLALIAFAWAAAGEAFGRRRDLQVIAAGAVTFLPQLGFISGVVNPDLLLAAIWAGFTWVALVLVRTGPRLRPLLALGLLAAASVLTHGRGVAILGPLAVTLGVVAWRARPLLRRTLLRLAAAVALTAAGGIAAVAYSAGHGGTSSIADEAGAAATAGSLTGFLSYLWQFYLPPLGSMSAVGPPYGYRQVYIEGLAGTFASLEVKFAPALYDVVQVLVGLGLVALVVALVLSRPQLRARGASLVVLLSLPASLLVVVHAAAYRQVISPSQDPLITGRYLLPLAPLFGLALAFLTSRLPRTPGALLGAGVLAFMAVLCVAGLGATVSRFYA